MDLYPSIIDDLIDFDSGWKYLVLGLPRWVPLVKVTKAHFARKRLLDTLKGLHAMLDAEAAGEEVGEPWSDVDDVSEEFRERSAMQREAGMTGTSRAVTDLTMLWR